MQLQHRSDKETCHECGLVICIPELAEKQKAVCPRCRYIFTAKHSNATERTLIFSITALLLFAFSLFFDFLTFKSNGIERTISLITSVDVLIQHNYGLLAIIQVITIFVIPCLILLSLIYLSSFMLIDKTPPKGKFIYSLLVKVLPWNMAEIFIISVLVSLVKIVALADIALEISFYVFILFALFMLAALLHFDQYLFLRWFHNGNQKSKVITASECKRRSCIQRTWALLITSILLYIPANIFPIMSTRLLGKEEPSTIIGGVLLLWSHGSYPIAIVIFLASVFVPLSKIAVLIWLNYSVQKNIDSMINERIKLYRIAEFIGRWSMVDVFVVIIIVSLVQLGDTMNVLPGYAITAFSGVVLFTMLAAMSFNPIFIYSRYSNDN